MANPSDSYSLTVEEEKDQQRSMPPRSPPSTSLQRQSSTNVRVIGEPEELASGLPSLPPIPSDNESKRSAKFLKSVNELGNLSVAIQAFNSRFDELQKHLDFIDKAIDARSKELAAASAASPTPTPAPSKEASDVVVQGTTTLPNPQPVAEKGGKSDSNPKSKAKVAEGEEKENELLTLCQTMCSRGLRKYLVSHLSETKTLREQVPVALRSAPKPSKLVFECIGRFFLQGSKAYNKDSPMIPARQASVLVLEYYLMSGGVENEAEVEPSLKEEAGLAAVAWRKRLIVEGGVSRACEIDARGLILFVACFGIPPVFKNDDIRDLVRLSNPGEISHALRQSQVLLKRISDMTEGMMKKGNVVEAVDLAYTFGFDEKLSPQTMLISFLQKSEEAWKKTKQETRGSPTVLKQASEKYLAALKSVVSCLEDHKIDFMKFLPGWQLKDKIINLEKDINDANRKIEEKRREVDKNNALKQVKIPEAKRPRFTVKDPSLASPSVTALQEQRFASYLDGNSYDGSLTSHLLDGRPYSHSNNYPTAASVPIGSFSGSLPESYLGGTVASMGNVLGGAMAGPSMATGIGTASGSYSGYQRDMIMDNFGTTLNGNGHLYRWHGRGEGAISNERSVGQSPTGYHASARVNNLYGPSTSVEGFAGFLDHPSIGVATRSGGSDLYSFADAVFDAEPFQGSSSSKAANLPPTLPAHGSSYLY